MLRNSSKQSEHTQRLVVGIDAGSTYTDGVLLNYRSRQIVSTAKVPTTRPDLSLGIMRTIDALPIRDASQIALVCLSTTLATNSIVEGRNLPVALVLIGYDPGMVKAFNLDPKLGTPIKHYFRGGHDVYGQEQGPPELGAIAEWVEDIKDAVSAIAVSSYFSPLDRGHEEKAYEAIARVADLPIVLGHQLSAQLNCVRRGATAALNASLIYPLADLIESVDGALQSRGIEAPLMVVRGDGALMNASTATSRPLETVLSGPAASAIGGQFLSGKQKAVVIDVGGTTTDIAVVEDGKVCVNQDGVMVGDFDTAIVAANIRSIGLGGDSELHFDCQRRLLIGPQRVVPLSYLATQHPEVKTELLALKPRGWTEPRLAELEYWFLPDKATSWVGNGTPNTRRLLDLLRLGPRSVANLLKDLDVVSPVLFDADRLLRESVIGRAGLTPTDLLHALGRLALWDTEVATAAATPLSRLHGQSPAEFAGRVLDQMSELIVAELVTHLSGRRLAPRLAGTDRDMGRWFFDNALYQMHRQLETQITLKYPIVGLGALAPLVLDKVAEILHTELVLPTHYAVGNAVGAAVGSVIVTRQALVLPTHSMTSEQEYCVQVRGARELMPDLPTALESARQRASHQARTGAIAAGAADPMVVVADTPAGVDGFRVSAMAVGAPRLGDGTLLIQE